MNGNIFQKKFKGRLVSFFTFVFWSNFLYKKVSEQITKIETSGNIMKYTCNGVLVAEWVIRSELKIGLLIG